MASITDVAREAGVPRQTVKDVMGAVARLVASGENVTLKEYGTFFQRTRKARKARNPRTGESVRVPAKTKMAFRTKLTLTEVVKNQKKKKAKKKGGAKLKKKK